MVAGGPLVSSQPASRPIGQKAARQVVGAASGDCQRQLEQSARPN